MHPLPVSWESGKELANTASDLGEAQVDVRGISIVDVAIAKYADLINMNELLLIGNSTGPVDQPQENLHRRFCSSATLPVIAQAGLEFGEEPDHEGGFEVPFEVLEIGVLPAFADAPTGVSCELFCKKARCGESRKILPLDTSDSLEPALDFGHLRVFSLETA
jgi:hypothetical protein